MCASVAFFLTLSLSLSLGETGGDLGGGHNIKKQRSASIWSCIARARCLGFGSIKRPVRNSSCFWTISNFQIFF